MGRCCNFDFLNWLSLRREEIPNKYMYLVMSATRRLLESRASYIHGRHWAGRKTGEMLSQVDCAVVRYAPVVAPLPRFQAISIN